MEQIGSDFDLAVGEMRWDEVVSTVHKVLKESQGNAPEPQSASGAERQIQRDEIIQQSQTPENRHNTQGNSPQDRQDSSSESVGSLEMMCAMEGPSCSPPPLRRSTRKKRSEEQPGIRQPQARKTPSAFILFKKEQRPKIMEELNISHNAAINAILGQRWRALTAEEQDTYRQHSEAQSSYSDSSGTKRKRDESNWASASASGSDREDQESKRACVSPLPPRTAPMENRCDTPPVAPPPRDVPPVEEAAPPRPSPPPPAEFTDMTPPPVPIPDEPLSVSALGITGELQLILENLESLENLASASHSTETQTPFKSTCVKSVQTDMAEPGGFHASPDSPPPSPPRSDHGVFRPPPEPCSDHGVFRPPPEPRSDHGVFRPPPEPSSDHGVFRPPPEPRSDHGVFRPPPEPSSDHGVFRPPPEPCSDHGVFRPPPELQSRHAGLESPLPSPQPGCDAAQPPPGPEGPTAPGEDHQEAPPTDASVSPPRTEYSPSQGIPEELQLLIEEIKFLSQKT